MCILCSDVAVKVFINKEKGKTGIVLNFFRERVRLRPVAYCSSALLLIISILCCFDFQCSLF